MEQEKKVGLALGSGASRGWAHIGVIEALVENNIPINLIAGCSVGSYVGAVYASGGLDRLKDYVLKMDGKKIFSFYDIMFSASGVLNGRKKVQELFFMHTEKETFEDLDLPLAMVACDQSNGTKVVIQSGKIIDGLRASMSYPGLFEPMERNGRWLIDGGVVDPVPISVARAMGADIVIAVDLNTSMREKVMDSKKKDYQDRQLKQLKESRKHKDNPKDNKNIFLKSFARHYDIAESIMSEKFHSLFNRKAAPNMLETVMSSIEIMQERISSINMAVEPPDLIIHPGLGGLKMLDFDQVETAINRGYESMMEKMDEIRVLL